MTWPLNPVRDITYAFYDEQAARQAARALVEAKCGARVRMAEDPGEWVVEATYGGLPDARRDEAIERLLDSLGGRWTGCGTYVGNPNR